jgi:3-oxoacyl-[acyl-carrier-protein] synthase III
MKVLSPGFKFNIRNVSRVWPQEKIMSNLDLLLRHPDTKDKPKSFLEDFALRIEKGFGFRTRSMAHLPATPFSPDEETSETLALKAVQKVLEGQNLHDVEAFVLGCTTSCRYTGSQATAILGRLGLTLPAFEMKAGCSTSLASLHFAQGLLAQGYNEILVCCAETLSKVVHPRVRETWFGLADGAAAIWMQSAPVDGKIQILKSVYSTDGKYVDLYTTPGILPPTREALEADEYFLMGDGAQLKELALEKYLAMIQALLPSQQDRAHLTWIIPHQVNWHLIEEVCKLAELPGEVLWSAREFGNLGGASVLFTLAQAVEEERFKPSDQILLMSVGGGLSFSAQLWRVCS